MSKYDVVISSLKMGDGDKILGENLLKAFIFTLAQKENLPEHLIFYGEGVKLTRGDSEALEDLRSLAGKGVEILSCGTCLDYYQMSEDLKVGKITTMSKIVDILSQGSLVIKP